MNCKICGGDMVGNGYTSHIHCEYAEGYEDKEPDAEPTLCDSKEDDENDLL